MEWAFRRFVEMISLDTGTALLSTAGGGGNGKYGCIGLTAGSTNDEVNEESFFGMMGLVNEERIGALSVLCRGELIVRLVSGDEATIGSRKLDRPLGVSANVRESIESERL